MLIFFLQAVYVSCSVSYVLYSHYVDMVIPAVSYIGGFEAILSDTGRCGGCKYNSDILPKVVISAILQLKAGHRHFLTQVVRDKRRQAVCLRMLYCCLSYRTLTDICGRALQLLVWRGHFLVKKCRSSFVIKAV